MTLKRMVFFMLVVLTSLAFVSCSTSTDDSIQGAPEGTYEWGLHLASVKGDKIDITVPDNLLNDDGPLSSEGKLEYSTDESCKVVITGVKDEDGLISEYWWEIVLNNRNAGTEFEYDFYDSERFQLVEAEAYPEYGEPGGILVVDPNLFSYSD